MSKKIKKGGLDQYGAERFGSLTFATVRKSVGLKELTKTNVRRIKHGGPFYCATFVGGGTISSDFHDTITSHN